MVGVDDETDGKGTISFRVYGDGKKLTQANVTSLLKATGLDR